MNGARIVAEGKSFSGFSCRLILYIVVVAAALRRSGWKVSISISNLSLLIFSSELSTFESNLLSRLIN